MLINSNLAKNSPEYLGYIILNGISNLKKDKISIYELSDILAKKGIKSSRHLIIGLSFLYSLDILDFEEANIWIRK